MKKKEVSSLDKVRVVNSLLGLNSQGIKQIPFNLCTFREIVQTQKTLNTSMPLLIVIFNDSSGSDIGIYKAKRSGITTIVEAYGISINSDNSKWIQLKVIDSNVVAINNRKDAGCLVRGFIISF